MDPYLKDLASTGVGGLLIFLFMRLLFDFLKQRKNSNGVTIAQVENVVRNVVATHYTSTIQPLWEGAKNTSEKQMDNLLNHQREHRKLLMDFVQNFTREVNRSLQEIKDKLPKEQWPPR